MERNRCVDLLRVCAIGAVVVGHWLLIDITDRSGHLSGLDTLPYIAWGRWLTLLLQVMPIFFVVGGYANAVSWTAHQGRGEHWAGWLRGRVLRLLLPTVAYVTVTFAVFACLRVAGAGGEALARVGWFVALHLWFLPVYLLLVTLTPLLHAAHRRWGMAVPAAMAAAAAGVDLAVLGFGVPLVGVANYLLVWGAMHQWGFAWQDGTLTRSRWRPGALAAAGAVCLIALLVWGPFPVDMIGTGAGTGVVNTAPPSIALLAFGAAQTGVVIAAEPFLQRLLDRPSRRRLVDRLNSAVMTAYLWHMAPVVVVALAFYRTGVMPQPVIGSAPWWALRAAWLVLLAVILVPLIALVLRAQRPLRALPGRRPAAAGLRTPVLVLCAVAAAVPGLADLAISGFAPGGHLAVLATVLCLGSLAAALLSARRPTQGPATTPGPKEPAPVAPHALDAPTTSGARRVTKAAARNGPEFRARSAAGQRGVTARRQPRPPGARRYPAVARTPDYGVVSGSWP